MQPRSSRDFRVIPVGNLDRVASISHVTMFARAIRWCRRLLPNCREQYGFADAKEGAKCNDECGGGDAFRCCARLGDEWNEIWDNFVRVLWNVIMILMFNNNESYYIFFFDFVIEIKQMCCFACTDFRRNYHLNIYQILFSINQCISLLWCSICN